MTQLIAVTNASTLISHQDAYAMTLACDWQARYHAAPAYSLMPPVVRLLNSGSNVPAGAWSVVLLDDPDQANALGYHTEDPGGRVSGKIFARPVLENGGDALHNQLSVCSVLSHEVLETLGDPACNRWSDTGRGILYATELADPVESDSYEVSVTPHGGGAQIRCTVSDFVLPAWFDPDAARHQQYDWMGLTTRPLQVRSTGYVITMSEGQVSQAFGEDYPEWRRATKEMPAARAAHRQYQGLGRS